MKVLQFAPYFIPYTGGQENYIYNLSNHLVRNGVQIDIVTSNYPKNIKKENIRNILVSRYPCLARPLRNPIVPKMLFPEEDIYDYDIIHTHNEHSFAAMAATYLSKKKKIPLVITCHGQLHFGNLFYDSIEKFYNRSIGRSIFESADAIITLSSSDKKYISSLGIEKNKIEIIPNAIDPDELERYHFGSDELESFKDSHNLSGKRIVLFIGQIIQRKGISYLLKAIPSVLQNTSGDTIFVFVGDGDYLEDSLRLAQEQGVEKNVFFMGSVSAKDLVAFYKISDLFVLPSLSEGLPTSILEAMFFSLPVISTNIPGVADHFKDLAILVPPKDEHALADAICRLLDDNSLASELSVKGRVGVLTQYTWDRIAESYGNLYAKLLDR